MVEKFEGIADKVAKQESLTELNRPRVSPSFRPEPAILMMSRLGIPVESIAARLNINRKTAKKYSENPRGGYGFFSLKHLNAKKSTQMAFINADWPPARRAYAFSEL